MKNHARKLALITGLSALLGSSLIVAQAQTTEVANVPFAFHTKGSTLPAGKYIIKIEGNNGVVQFADAKTGNSVLLGTRGRESGNNDEPRLTFHRYGNEYFLSEIWMPGQANGYNCWKSAREKELEKEPGKITLASIRLMGR
jgi:hypothetical protein